MGDGNSTQFPPQVRVIVWGLPRTISTALTKCLSFIEDIDVWLEPYGYAHAAWLGAKGVLNLDLPPVYEGNEEVFAQAAGLLGAFTKSTIVPDRLAYTNVQKSLETARGRYVFVKDMSQSMIPEFRGCMPKGYRHVFLIRDPSQLFLSYRKSMYNHLRGLGRLEGKSLEDYDIIADDKVFINPRSLYKNHYEVWQHVREFHDPNAIVIDSTDILNEPAKMLRTLLTAIELPYSDALLQWPASTEELRGWHTPGESILESHVNFYGAAMKSTHFAAPSKPVSRDQLSADIIRCLEASSPFFEEMYAVRIK